ncbi:MAG TPA: hypothetical protein VG520_02875 [Candidatus Dormibacteraeota bacterium]|nr:hypothetical protein [Candidatus Dormibacteraeota bacterium]
MPTQWGNAVVCAACGRRLLPLSYAMSLDDDPSGVEYHPHLRCAGCGQCYQWQSASGWASAPPVRGRA